MLSCAQAFADDLQSKGLEFDVREDSDGDVILTFPYDGKLTNFIFTGEDGTRVSMYTRLETIAEDKVSDLIILCNTLNTNYKWLKFFVDRDNDLMIQDDAILSPDTAAEECFDLLLTRVRIYKECKPQIMRAIYC